MTRGRVLVFCCGVLIIALVITTACTGLSATTTNQGPGIKTTAKSAPSAAGSNRGAPATSAPMSTVAPQVPAAPLLGRPEAHSVNVNVLPADNLEVYLKYRSSTGSTSLETIPVAAQNGVPVNILLSGLEQDTAYLYQVCWRRTTDTFDQCSPDYSFHTQRSPGSSFTFDIQADSHLDDHASGDLYQQTLANELVDNPDFLIDLGDTSMTDKLPVKNTDTIRARYILQRTYLNTVGHSVPLFLVLGNHDGETGYALNGKDRSLALLSLQFRKMYFPNPEPDGFYTGNAVNEKDTGLRQDYYAWQWGDALFIALDPFWYILSKPGGNTDGWGWTLGKTQYDWLKETLATKKARYTFIFSHHLVGGAFPEARGGIEYASFYEWGGNNTDGSYGFDQHRPGWGVPIRQLLVENNVTAFFHGHDHLFARQELDGITYQDVPQPATPGSPDPGADYGYVSGTMLPSPGHLRISVAPESARVDYIGSAVEGTTRSTGTNGAVIYSYTLKPRTDVSGG